MRKCGIYFVLAFLLPSLVMAQSVIPTASYIFNVSYEDAQDAIGKALSETENKKITAVINGRKLTPLYSSNKPVDVEVRGLRADNNKASWNASMVILEGENVISALPLAGRYLVMEDVPVLRKPLRNGDVITDSDIEVKSFPQERTASDTIRDVGDLVGRMPVRAVSPNRPIRNSEVSAPFLIKKNTLVKMRYKTDTMEITTSGQALDGGAKGDVIEVRNTDSKKTVRAVVAGNNVVDVIAQGVQASRVEVQ